VPFLALVKETSGSVKGKEFIEQLNNSQMLKKKLAPLFMPPSIQSSLMDFRNM
jgi:hypothetical protein